MKKEKDFERIQFVPVLQGGIALFHRPPRQALEYLKRNTPCTNIFTLQASTECPKEVMSICNHLGLGWNWVELRGAKKQFLRSREVHSKLKEGLIEARSLLERGAFILIHCAAGIHRTGLFAYALLRIAGDPEGEVLEKIRTARLETFNGCGNFRFAIAEELAACILNEEAISNE